MIRNAYHKQLDRLIEIVEDRGDKFLVNVPGRGHVESPKHFYDLTIRGFKSLQRHRAKIEAAQQKQITEIRKHQLVFIRRKLMRTGKIVRLSYAERAAVDAGRLILIRHRKIWWLGTPRQREELINAWINNSYTKDMERRLRRLK